MRGKHAWSPRREGSMMAGLLHHLTDKSEGLSKRNLNHLQPVGSRVGNPDENQNQPLLLQKQSLHNVFVNCA